MVQQAGIFELRFYKIAHGREGDMLARVQQDWNVLFPRHGIRPLGCWTAVSAKTLPMFVYITPFKDMADREACWAGFYGDTDWHEARTRTNAGSELVERYDICFVRGLGGGGGGGAAVADGSGDDHAGPGTASKNPWTKVVHGSGSKHV